MRCAWQELLSILPEWLRDQMDQEAEQELQELRLRIGRAPELIEAKGLRRLRGQMARQDLDFCVNTASRYSPWASQTVSKGFLTAPGGHRVGICGEATMASGRMVGIKSISSLCIRVARDYTGIGKELDQYRGSILLVGPPGSGKTTLLRDIIRRRSVQHQIGVVDERMELFPSHFRTGEGENIDVLSGCTKPVGIEMLIRTMGPSVIAVDEITASEDCKALFEAAWCGIHLLATVHAFDRSDLMERSVYRPIFEKCIFDWIVIMQHDKTWRVERLHL